MAAVGSETASQQPAITVLVALFNCEEYIGECLESLKNQTFGDFEVIVVDNSSTDNSLSVARACVQGDNRFLVLSSKLNDGPGAARNLALSRARGEFVLYVDSDDLLAYDALQKLIIRARAQQLDELHFNAQSFYEDSAATQAMHEDFDNRDSFEGVATGRELFTFFSNCNQYFTQGALRMVRREVLERRSIRFPEGIIHEDVLYGFLVSMASQRSSFLNEPLYLRRQRANSIMGARRCTVDSVIGHLTVICCVRAWVSEHASLCDDAFLQAIGREVGLWSRLVACDWSEVLTDSERTAIAKGLFEDNPRLLYFDILGAGDAAERAAAEFRESQTYKLGDTLAAIPRKVRVHMRAIRNRRKIKDVKGKA